MHLDIMRGASWLRENKSRFFTVLLFFFLFSPFPLLQQTVIAEDTVNVGIEKIWVDNNNADNTRPNSVGVTLSKPGTDYQVTLNSANDWKDIISDVDISGNYSVKETGIPDGYTTAVVQGELVSRYSYPTNISAVDIDLSTTVRDPIEITPPSGWYISDGMYTDYILTPTVFFNFNADSIKKATLVEYDGDGNEVTSQKQFQKYESSVQWAKSSGNPGTDHYITLTFKDAAVINDGTLNGTKRDVVLTINNFRSSTTGGFGFTTFLTSSGNWLNAAASGDKLNFDVNFRVPGITNGRTAITFVDLDVTSGPEAVYLRSGFEKTVYTISLNRSSINSNPMLLSGNKLGVSAVEDNLIMYAKASDDDSYKTGLLAMAELDEDGFTFEWQGKGCGTMIFVNVEPIKLKVTIDGNTSVFNGGTVSNIGNWVYRNYGEPALITATPDEGYHIGTLTIDGVKYTAENLKSKFNSNGSWTLSTGYDKNKKETITLYQRENGVIDILLPKQFFASSSNSKAAPRVNHWIDVSFESNGLAYKYTVTNTLTTDISGTKTWVNGLASKPENNELIFSIYRKNERETGWTSVPFESSQVSWEGDKYG